MNRYQILQISKFEILYIFISIICHHPLFLLQHVFCYCSWSQPNTQWLCWPSMWWVYIYPPPHYYSASKHVEFSIADMVVIELHLLHVDHAKISIVNRKWISTDLWYSVTVQENNSVKGCKCNLSRGWPKGFLSNSYYTKV